MQHRQAQDMNRAEMFRPDDSPAWGTSAPIRSTDADVAGEASDIPSPPAHIDARAVSAVSIKALARYQATKELLFAGQRTKQPLSLR
ncbi:hypothetical protein GCM10011487_26810 [Steroidobacter agaridevorans]|uniref:Uncharacterized protein n=1 Tax=Steroidobacter agaridevorans TaxID=2695856 RepID=A0A829YCW4_9GAMM|nr:hypothetical protein GCM10011487_26810 [Steroidobacter agaridevorans]